MNNLSVKIVHQIPGRIRLRLEKPPKHITEFINNVSKHEGIEIVSFDHYTKSLLVYYGPSVVSATEIFIRVGVLLSLEYGSAPIQLVQKEDGHALTSLDYYAAASLGLAYLGKAAVLTPNTLRVLDYNAAYSTLFAVLNHAWREVKRDGVYDPEVISVVYLINSMIRGNSLLASLITWIVTFGRHLTVHKPEVLILEATEIEAENDQIYVEVTVRPMTGTQIKDDPIKLLIFGLSRIVGISPSNQNNSIFQQIQYMSRKHGNMLEAVGNERGPVYMRLNP